MKKVVTLLFLTLCLTKSYSQNMFACFENDKKPDLKISVYFDKNDKAKFVKYKGQNETIPLFYSKRETTNNDGGIPAVYWAEIYTEKYRGKVTGTYTFTNAGTHGLDVTFKRKKDGKEFYFAIIEGSQDSDNSTYSSQPCF